MRKLTVSKNSKGEYYSSVQFALMDGGYGAYKHTNKTKNPPEITWEVVQELPDGGMLVQVMNPAEYTKYLADKQI